MLLTLHPVVLNGRAPWPEMADLAARTGFAGVEVPVAQAMETPPKDTLARLKRLKLRAGAIGLPVEIRKDKETFRKDLAILDKAAGYAAAIGCPRMATWIPSSADLPKDEQRKLMLGRIKAVCDALARSHVRLGLEFLGPLHIRRARPHEFIWKMPEMLEFARECGSNCGLLLDSWHWHHAGATAEDIVRAGRDAIVHVHLADAPKLPPEQIKDNERLLPGEGVVDWAGFLGALQKIGYKDALSPEVFGRGLKDMPVEEAAKLVFTSTRDLLAKHGIRA
jgi:sugar phosphate isomerase/epimerase